MIYQEYSSISREECYFCRGHLYGVGVLQREESSRKWFYLMEEDINFCFELFLEITVQFIQPLCHCFADCFVKEFWPLKTIWQGNSPQASATAQKIERKLEELNNKLQNAVVAQVAEDFMDTTTNLKQLEKAARAPPGEIQWRWTTYIALWDIHPFSSNVSFILSTEFLLLVL